MKEANQIISLSYSKVWPPLLKVGLVVGLLTLIYIQVFERNDIQDLMNVFTASWTAKSFLYLTATLILMPINWALEAIKWKKIVSGFRKLSFYESMQSILAGVSVGIITPARIGEYAGRFYMMEKEDRWKTIYSTFIGSLAQNIITGVIGIIGAAYLLNYSVVMNPYIASSLFFISSLGILLGLLVYFKIGMLQPIVNIIPIKRVVRLMDVHSQFLKEITPKLLNEVLSLSFLRYMIYSLQYLLILYFFGIEVPFLEALSVISLLFLIQSGLPLPPLIGIIARGEIALTLWTFYSDNSLGILATSLSIWIINLLIPALIGLIYVIVHKE